MERLLLGPTSHARRLLLDNFAEVNRATKDGRTPLYVAARTATSTRRMAAAGQAGGATEKNGWTPLYAACCWGHVEAARLLLEKGAEVDRGVSERCDAAVRACEKGHIDTARLLLDKGAEVDWASKEGGTPLSIACYAARRRGAAAAGERRGGRPGEEDGATPLYPRAKRPRRRGAASCWRKARRSIGRTCTVRRRWTPRATRGTPPWCDGRCPVIDCKSHTSA